MKKFVAFEKQSKSAQRAYHKQRRNTWGTVNPVPRIVKDRTKYDRKRIKDIDRFEPSKEGFLILRTV